jgi:hypothetical protein
LRKSSFASMLLRCLRTVCSLIESKRAISRQASPSAIARRISASRFVSGDGAWITQPIARDRTSLSRQTMSSSLPGVTL